MKFYSLICWLLLGTWSILAQSDLKITSLATGNPIVPGYFADPTIKKFGDIYYIYATTDNEMLASGVPTVWYSRDFKQWYNYTMEVPSLKAVNLRNFWAPDILKGLDNRYYLYFGNCQSGCNIYGYVSDTPIGPWIKLNADDHPVIQHHFPRKGFPSLDAQFFTDDDGKIYAYWGTWVHYNGGFAVGELDRTTMRSVSKAKNIPLDQTPEPFEAAYMMKRNGIYFLMYSGASCHDETYNVRYSFSDHPYGPFKPGQINPILSTSDDQTIHGPGHHSVLKEDEDYYIVYHRHNYPLMRGGMARQLSIDPLVFKNDTTLAVVQASHKGVSAINNTLNDAPNDLAFGKKVSASSSYYLNTPTANFHYKPSFISDHNNATLWKASDQRFPQEIQLDLGAVEQVARIRTEFEFASYYYQYKIHYSKDGEHWALYADRSQNRTAGSPMIDDQNVEARYIKLTVLGTEKTGLFAAVWNMKVYPSLFDIPLNLHNKPSLIPPAVPSSKSLLFSIDAKDLSVNNPLTNLNNDGSIGGAFSKTGEVSLINEQGIKALKFTNGALVLNKKVPETLAWNASFTVATWVKNPTISKADECLVSWCDRHEFQLANSYNALFYNSSPYGAAAHLDGHFDMAYNKLPKEDEWHHLVLTFDGVTEKIYVDGVLDNAQVMSLSSAIDKAKIRIGSSDVGEAFTGLMASVKMYDYALSHTEIKALQKNTNPRP